MGEGGSVDDTTVADVAAGVRTLLTAIDAGEVEATDIQRAYLAGAVETLDVLVARCVSTPPTVHDTGV